MSNEYDAAVAASLQPDPAQSARVGFVLASDTNPDAYAEARRVALRTGVPVDTALAVPQEIKRQDAVGSIDFATLAKTSPATARLLGDIDKAKIAHDNVDSMTQVESALYQLGKFEVGTATAIASLVPKFNEGAWGVARAGADLLPDFVGKPMADYFARLGGTSRQTAEGMIPKTESLLGASWYSGMQSLGLNALMLPLAVVSGGSAVPVLAGMGLTQAGQSYGEARDKGVGTFPALGFAASQGVIEAGTEMIGMPALLSILKPGKLAQKALDYLVKDQGGEQIATHLQGLNDWAVLNPDKPFTDYLAERPAAAAQTALSTVFSGGGQVAVMKGLEVFARRNDLRVQQANAGAELLARLNQLAAADKVLARDADTFEQFVAQSAENGPVQQVFIDGRTLMQSGVAEQVVAVSPAVASQLNDAVQTGGQIAIPVEEYAARIAPTDAAASLLDHLRTEDEGFSRAEAQTYLQTHAEELHAEVERAAREAQGDDVFKQSAEAVKLAVKTQLDTAARFAPYVNDAYAALVGNFYAVTAAKVGITPEAMFERYPLRIGAERIDGQQFEQSDSDRDLVVTHNLSADNLLHAVKMGGIAVPSLAVTKKDTPLAGFGEVTLIGSKDMADPQGYAGTKVFGADIYSPRYPKINYTFSANAKKHGDAQVKQGADATGTWIEWDQVGTEGARELERAPALMWVFLNERGIEPTVVRVEPKPLAAALQSFVQDARDAFDLKNSPDFVDAAYQSFIDQFVAANGEEARATAEEQTAKMRADAAKRGVDYFVRDAAGQVERFRRDSREAGRIDTRATQFALEEQIRKADLQGEMEKYAADFLRDVGPEEKIFQGYTNSGNRKYIPHTLENVVKILKKELRGGENFNYGVGSLRAKFTPQFKSIAQIKKAKGRLVDKATFEKVKKEIDDQFWEAARALNPDMSSETAISIMEDAAKMGVQRAAKGYGFDVSAENAQIVAEFMTRLRELPTEYFEAKILRDVDLTEFSGAVVPEGVDPKVIDALQARGVKDIRTYKKGDEADRAAKIGEFENLFFQNNGDARGTFNSATLSISLLKNADLSTFLHESGHFFLEVTADLAAQPDAAESVRKDMAVLLDWFGVKSLDEWHSLDFEEKRSYHEQYARGFEAYLFKGETPSIELQGLFQRFRAWLLNVYRDLKALNVELTPEVRGVFDRMLATTEQIQLAEQGRSMFPLFASPEQSGMTPEEFAAYQANGVEATASAIQDLQGRGLRDMQWLHNARGRIIGQLQKEAKARRAEVQMDVRREVMSQPVYRAWQFLTGKPGDKTDAQKAYDSALSDWGKDRADFEQKTRETLREKLIAANPEVKGLDRGQLIAKNKRQMDIDAQQALLDWDKTHSKPEAPAPQAEGETYGGNSFARINIDALTEMGLPAEFANHLKALRMTAKDGLHPDIVAEMFGFTSGDELVRRLAAAPTPKDEINALTDQRMLEQYGELSSPEAIEKAADRAIHNDARARFVATEANALAKATGQRKVLVSAAKAYAAATISRLKVRSVKPGQYASAEERAAKAAAKASRAGDLATAAAEKRNQVLQLQLTRAAYDAQEEIDKGLRYLRKFARESRTLDADYADQIDALLERFELRPISNKETDRRTSLANWLTAQREAGLEPDIPPELADEAFRTSYKNMTVEEFRGLVDSVKQIEHLGRLKHRLMTAADKREFKAIVEEAASSIREHGGDERPIELEGEKGLKPWLEGIAAGHRKLASLLRQMDGGRDNGPLWRLLGRTMNEAATSESVMNEQATESLSRLYAPVLALKGGLTGSKVFIPEINASLTRGGRLAVALNLGNAANRQRLMDGNRWNTTQIAAIVRHLTPTEAKFVNEAWAFIDGLWPEIAAKEKRVTGREPEKVEADPFTMQLADGSSVAMRGGYYPLKYDAARDDRAEKHDAAAIANDMKRGAFTRATTRRGHTKARIEEVKRPVRLDLSVITEHVQQVTHDIAWHEWLIDANRLIDAHPINQAIRDHYGSSVIRTIKDTLQAIATADVVPQTKIDQAMLYLRSSVARSTMGLSLTTALMQPFGLTQSMGRIGIPHVLRGMTRWGGDVARFKDATGWIYEKSDFMRLRDKTFNRELHEINGRVSKGHSTGRQVYDAALFVFMQKMQKVADVPTWIGAYEKARSEARDDATSVALADQAVLDSQGGGQTKDMTELQRKHPFLAMFYSYFSVTYNLAAEKTAATDFRSPVAVAGWLSDMALLMVIPALVPALLTELLRGGGDDDPEAWAKKLVKWQAGYLLGTMMGLREAYGVVTGYDYAGPPIGRVISEIGKFGKQAAQGELDEALGMSAVRLLGVTTGLPTTQIIRSYRGWQAWADGDAPATAVLMGPPPMD